MTAHIHKGVPLPTSSWFEASIVFDLVNYVYPVYNFGLLWSILSTVSILSIWFAPIEMLKNAPLTCAA